MKYNSTNIHGLLGRPLNDIENKYAPQTIYYEGKIPIPLPSPRISIIGTRKPTSQAVVEAEKITKTLVENNVIIVSGLAGGIDSIGHRTAIQNGGKTIAVLGTPLNKTYPQENTELQHEIMRNHLAVSQYEVGHNTTPKDFAIRNKTMALISNATVIIEALDGGGTLHHARETLRLGKPLFISKRMTEEQILKWPKEMANQGAIIFHDTIDILEFVLQSV